MRKLFENKNHLIDRLNLTSEQKEEIKAFFLKHPSYESKIDWNNKSLQYKDFESLLALDGKSKNQAKKYGLAGLVEGKDYVDFGEVNIPSLGECHLYQPLSHLGSVVLASNKVPPIKENGAKWCISMSSTNEYWEDYTLNDLKFLFLFTQNTKYALTIYPKSSIFKKEIYTFEDENIGWPKEFNNPYLLECIKTLKKIPKPSLNELLKKYKDILVKNSDGTIDKVSEENIPASYFIRNGHFICQFNNWKGDFECTSKQLVSLEGCPQKIEGSFYGGGNKLTSLKGAPKIVSRDFICTCNKLLSLKEGPLKVGGNYCCQSNKLNSLKGSPDVIWGNFVAYDNQLLSLKGGPEIVKGSFNCGHNKLNSLKGAPLKIEGNFICRENPSLTPSALDIDNFSTRIKGGIFCDSFLRKIFKDKGYSIYHDKY